MRKLLDWKTQELQCSTRNKARGSWLLTLTEGKQMSVRGLVRSRFAASRAAAPRQEESGDRAVAPA